ncbi:hypothetical protein H6A64_14905, partial [Lacrimispora saccharolytica]|nr:hypothetical protein [Lacrimispora saccharolytica]
MAYSQEERDAPANQKQEFPYAKTDDYAAEAMDQTAYRTNWWAGRNAENAKSVAKKGKISERPEEKTSEQFQGR